MRYPILGAPDRPSGVPGRQVGGPPLRRTGAFLLFATLFGLLTTSTVCQERQPGIAPPPKETILSWLRNRYISSYKYDWCGKTDRGKSYRENLSQFMDKCSLPNWEKLAADKQFARIDADAANLMQNDSDVARRRFGAVDSGEVSCEDFLSNEAARLAGHSGNPFPFNVVGESCNDLSGLAPGAPHTSTTR